MWRVFTPRRTLSLALAVGLLSAAPATTQSPPRTGPRLEAVAETRLLMEGLAQANFRGLEGHLKQKPADAETWAFARGQALLIAETGNLLMIRPPRNQQGQAAWMERATELRTAATRLARDVGNRDFERSRASLNELALSCNHCHQTFRVPVRVTPFAAAPAEGVK